MLAPLLTEFDPGTSSEGSLDPVGLYAIADSLALKLIPGVRERQKHPRYLTAIAVSLAVCREFGEDMVAKDGFSEPWILFEWYFVEGLVRTITDSQKLTGLPGREKVAAAIRDNVPVSAKRYLKTPAVFGFHGVYRLLARTLGTEIAGRLGEGGFELLEVWTKEQGLKRFLGTENEAGAEWLGMIVGAIGDGLEKGAVSRGAGWSGWNFFSDYLAPYAIGPKEAKCIATAILTDQVGFRKAVLEFLVSGNGQRIIQEMVQKDPWSERPFHMALCSVSDDPLRGLLRSIMTYETFARLVQDAFDDCLYAMSLRRGKVAPNELSTMNCVVKAAREVPEIFYRLTEELSPFGESVRFQESFKDLAETLEPGDWVQLLLEHHRRVQSAKPPDGKASWFERFDDGSCIIRPAYMKDQGGLGDDSYVHPYRTGSLSSFSRDLGMVS